MANKKRARRCKLVPPIVSDLEELRAVRLARQLAIEWIEGTLGETLADQDFNFAYLRELLHLARARESAAGELEQLVFEGESLGVTVHRLRYLPEISFRHFETVVVDMPGGASSSRCVH